MLMNEKQFYTSPEVDVLVVRFEEALLVVSGKGDVIKANEVDYGDF